MSFTRRGFVMGAALCVAALAGCSLMQEAPVEFPKVTSVRLMTLDPGHFHAALVQKSMYPDVEALVHVYAPGGASADDLAQHLGRINTFNTRADDPTRWREEVYTGADYLEKMLREKPGNVVVIAGNNVRRTDYLERCAEAGLNVLVDKPIAISPGDFAKLPEVFAAAERHRVMFYDIMTERYEITTILQRELAQVPAVFGELVKGTQEAPAIAMASVHFFSKVVAGSPLKRPAWAYDVRQEGEGIVDVATHLVDLVQWEAFPEVPLSPGDARVAAARHWTTPITLAQFSKSTGEAQFPEVLKGDVKDGVLQVYSNGEFTYQLRGVWCSVKVTWDWEAVAGGDTHYSNMLGTKARLVIRQGAEQAYKPVLYVESMGEASREGPAFGARLKEAVDALQAKYPGVGFVRDGAAWRITVPEKYDVGHEAHAAQVTRRFLEFLHTGRMPDWEMANMRTKYDTLRQAYALSHQ